MNLETWFDLANLIAIFSIYAFSVNVVIGWGGIPAVVPTAFGAIGGYTAAYLAVSQGWPTLLATVAGVLAAALVGLILSGPTLRLSVGYIILMSVAAASVIVGVIENLSFLGGQVGIYVTNTNIFGFHLVSVASFLPFTISIAVLCYLFVRYVGGSSFGILLKGIREDPLAVRASGFNPTAAKITAFTTSAALAGLAGALFVDYANIASPLTFSFTDSILIVAMVIIGGLGRPIAAAAGAALVEIVPRLLQNLGGLSAADSAEVQRIAFGVALILVMIWRPMGLLPEKPARLVRTFVKRRARAAPVASIETNSTQAVDNASAPQVEIDSPVSMAREPGAVVLRATELRKRFGGLVAADGFDFELRQGEVVGIVGPNGAGKTTLFNLLTGALPADSGSVNVFGVDVTGYSMDRVFAVGMARSFQDVRLIGGLTVLENVLLGSLDRRTATLRRALIFPRAARRESIDALDRAMSAVRLVGMESKALAIAGTLSFGEQKLVALARLVATDARILLLDEPTAGVGTEISRQLLDLIGTLRMQGHTILVVEHNLEVIRNLATNIYFLDSGRIHAQGTYEELIADPELATLYFGTSAAGPSASVVSKRIEVLD
jgi:branched-chain amino acid transport system permease protein